MLRWQNKKRRKIRKEIRISINHKNRLLCILKMEKLDSVIRASINLVYSSSMIPITLFSPFKFQNIYRLLSYRLILTRNG